VSGVWVVSGWPPVRPTTACCPCRRASRGSTCFWQRPPGDSPASALLAAAVLLAVDEDGQNRHDRPTAGAARPRCPAPFGRHGVPPTHANVTSPAPQPAAPPHQPAAVGRPLTDRANLLSELPARRPHFRPRTRTRAVDARHPTSCRPADPQTRRQRVASGQALVTSWAGLGVRTWLRLCCGHFRPRDAFCLSLSPLAVAENVLLKRTTRPCSAASVFSGAVRGIDA
jgi:hypothetical protein